MAVKLELDKPKDTKETRILLVINHYNTKLRYPTGEKVKPADWNKEKEEVRRSHAECFEINTRITKQREAVKIAINSLIRENQPITREAIQENTNGLLAGKATSITFVDYLSTLIQEMEAGEILTRRGRPLSKGSIDSYKWLLTSISKFQNGKPVLLKQVDTKYINSYLSTFTNKSANYISKMAMLVKTTLKKAKAGKQEVQEVNVGTALELTDQIVLSETELTLLYNLKLKGAKEKARDLFLVGCYTGLRFSDLNKIKADNITAAESGYRLTVETQKTHDKIIIPLNAKAVEVLKKYNWKIPKAVNQHFNMYIKEVARLAGINEQITTGKTRDGHRIEIVSEKWQLVSSHTMRRSFSTNLYLAGANTTLIRKLTGHKTESSFFRYIRIEKDQAADLAAKLDFFQ